METLHQARSEGTLAPAILAVLGRCCTLFGLGLVEAGAADLLEAGWMSGKSPSVLLAPLPLSADSVKQTPTDKKSVGHAGQGRGQTFINRLPANLHMSKSRFSFY